MPDDNPPSIGHNQPPSEAHLLQADLKERHAKVFEQALKLLEACDRAPAQVLDEEAAKKMSDFVAQIAAAWKVADETRDIEKRPYLERGNAVQGLFNSILQPLDVAKRTMLGRLNKYLTDKATAERKAREEAAKLAEQEAEAARRRAAAAERAATDEASLDAAVTAATAAAQAENEAAAARVATTAKTAELVRTHGTYGSTLTQRINWDVIIEDRTQLDLEALRPYLSETDLVKAARAFVRTGGRSLKGARIFQQTGAVVRG